MANDMSPEPFEAFAFDGVLGLGLNALLLNDKFSFFGQMTEQHPDMLPYFSVYLARTEEEGDSLITFGGYEPERAESDLSWAPVAMQHLGYWQVHIKRVLMGDEILEECTDGSCRAILDTGTSLLGVPREASRIMHRALARPVPDAMIDENGSANKVDCRSLSGGVDLHFDLGDGLVVTLSPEDYSRPNPINITADNVTRPYCRSLLLPLDMKAPVGPNIFIWGEPMLRKYYTIFDWKSRRIGFANAVSSGLRGAVGRVNLGNSAAASAIVGKPDSGSLMVGAPLARTTG